MHLCMLKHNQHPVHSCPKKEKINNNNNKINKEINKSCALFGVRNKIFNQTEAYLTDQLF